MSSTKYSPAEVFVYVLETEHQSCRVCGKAYTGYLGHPFTESGGFCERMSQVASIVHQKGEAQTLQQALHFF